MRGATKEEFGVRNLFSFIINSSFTESLLVVSAKTATLPSPSMYNTCRANMCTVDVSVCNTAVNTSEPVLQKHVRNVAINSRGLAMSSSNT